MRSNKIMILDFTGTVSEGQADAAFEASVLYLRHRHTGAMRFEHAGANGTIESFGSYVWGGVSGERFKIAFEGEGEDRDLAFLIPSMYHNLPVRNTAAVFSAVPRKRGTVPKRQGHTVH